MSVKLRLGVWVGVGVRFFRLFFFLIISFFNSNFFLVLEPGSSFLL